MMLSRKLGRRRKFCVKSGLHITAGLMGYVNVIGILFMVAVMERCSVIVRGEKGIGGDEGDGVMNEADKSCTTRVIRTVLMDSGVVWEGVCW